MIGKLGAGVAVAALVLATMGCSSVKVPAGEEAVLIQQPIFFGEGGIVPTSVKTGREYVAWTTRDIRVNMRPQQVGIEFEDLMSSDGVPLDFDAVVRVQVVDSVDLIRRFGEKWYANNLDSEIRTRVRQSVRKYSMNDTAINSKAIEAIDNEVTSGVQDYLRAAKLPVRLLSFTVGRANPPEQIKQQRVETVKQSERLQTERTAKLAEDGRLERERSRAAADNGYRSAMSLSPEQFVELERIKAFRDICGRNGRGCQIYMGGGQPLISMN